MSQKTVKKQLGFNINSNSATPNRQQKSIQYIFSILGRDVILHKLNIEYDVIQLIL